MQAGKASVAHVAKRGVAFFWLRPGKVRSMTIALQNEGTGWLVRLGLIGSNIPVRSLYKG